MDMSTWKNGFIQNCGKNLTLRIFSNYRLELRMADSGPILPCYPIVGFHLLWNVKKYEFCICDTSLDDHGKFRGQNP